ncbi:hypothetical protein MHK_004664 [Candidatus Magnetomorum sp. HK-1]|nr:hypothetical protein MHK_004664 [Candidatus Magnetomorum sp. HK-1]
MALEIRKKLARDDPENSNAQNDLFVSFYNIGAIQLQQSKMKSALKTYEQALKIIKKLSIKDPDNTILKRHLYCNYSRISRIYEQMNESFNAINYVTKGLEIAEKLQILDPDNSFYKLEILEFKGIIARLSGDQQLTINKHEKALDFYNSALQFSKKAYDADKSNTDARYDVHVNYRKIGEAYAMLGKPQAALDAWQKALSIVKGCFNENEPSLARKEFLLLNQLIHDLNKVTEP